MNNLLRLTDHGLYCERGDFYIDPRHAVDCAVITHAHADHARAGHRQYIAHPITLAFMRRRLHSSVAGLALRYGETVIRNGVQLSLHPAGHVPGSSQVHVEYQGYVAVVTGDYKLEPDGLSDPFEQLRCNLFITESTFALPVFRWRPQAEVFGEIVEWYRANVAAGLTTVLSAYALGKAQRLIHNLAPMVDEIIVHKSIATLNEALEEVGVTLPQCTTLNPTRLNASTVGSLIIATSQALREGWVGRIGPYRIGAISGWMALPQMSNRRGADRGFVLSDHADWPGLQQAVKASEAEFVLASHGYSDVLVRWSREQGMAAEELDKWGKEEKEGQPEDLFR